MTTQTIEEKLAALESRIDTLTALAFVLSENRNLDHLLAQLPAAPVAEIALPTENVSATIPDSPIESQGGANDNVDHSEKSA
ncbi:hypothetical protein UFOVP413_13 [uncultured Caudovirales phage]|uniref:Uncharacterized protein n=1 Tax=uncultured Caudovirales phage TaxID=2100421 RepID=A0A6J5M6C0_9CAUD|nr:hypothetical protein UFOVP413_13 [uncultured Caudovirales phage]